MLSTNDYQERRQSKFAIHKLIIGAMSILLGIAFLANSQTVKAGAVISNIQKTKLTTYSGLNSFLMSRDDDKTSKDKLATHPVIVEKNHTNVAKDRPAHTVQTEADHIHQGNWNNINVTYNDETQELTLLGGTDDTPAIMQNGEELESLFSFLPRVSGSRATLKKITIQGKIKAQGSANELFESMPQWEENLTSIEGLAKLDTSEVTDMSYMFNGCERLTSLDVTHFDTSKVTDMRNMFNDCESLTSLDLSHFDTSQVTDMSNLLNGCENLTSLDVSHFNTSKVIAMVSMFAGCHSLTSLDVTHFDTSKVVDMVSMFAGCESLTSLDVTHFDTSKVTDMSVMFYDCRSLTSLDVTHFDTSKVIAMGGMFNGCERLASLDVTHFDTSKVTDMEEMFEGCKQLSSVDVTHFDTSKVEYMSYMFYDCQSLTSLDVTHFDTSRVTDMEYMFQNCPNLRQLSLGKSFKFLQEQEQKTYLEDLPGKWINWGVANQQLPKGTKQWTSKEFTANYNGATDYDTYVRFINFGGPITIQYRDQNGNKIPNIADEQQYGNVGDSLIDKTNPNSILSFKRKDIAGYNFDHAEIDGQKIDLADIKYTDNPQTLTLFYAKANSDNNGGNNTNDSNNTNGSDNSNGANNTNGSNDSNGQNSPNDSSSIKIPVEFASNATLRHNAYLYDDNGKRANSVTLKADSIITVYGNKNINGRKFYILIDNKKKYYVAVGNVKPVSRKLKHNAYVYNKYGQRIKKAGVFKKAKRLNTFGDPVTIRGRHYFIIDNSRFVKAANFASISSAKIVTTAGFKAGTRNKSKAAAKTIMHNAYLYNNQGKRANKIIISAGSKINTLNLAKINNRLYYKLEDGLYIAAGNIKAAKLKLKHNAYIYSQYGNRIGKKVLKKRKFVKTYGYAVSIKHKKYYITAKNKFVKKANFR